MAFIFLGPRPTWDEVDLLGITEDELDALLLIWDQYDNLPGYGIASQEAFGTPSVQRVASPGSITSEETFGTPVVTAVVSISSPGIASTETFGTAVVVVTVYPSGIASGEAFGTPLVLITAFVLPGGIASGEAFGTPAVLPGPVTIAPAGIASQEAFGVPGPVPSHELWETPLVPFAQTFADEIPLDPTAVDAGYLNIVEEAIQVVVATEITWGTTADEIPLDPDAPAVDEFDRIIVVVATDAGRSAVESTSVIDSVSTDQAGAPETDESTYTHGDLDEQTRPVFQ